MNRVASRIMKTICSTALAGICVLSAAGFTGCAAKNENTPDTQVTEKPASPASSAVDFEHELDDYVPKKNEYSF